MKTKKLARSLIKDSQEVIDNVETEREAEGDIKLLRRVIDEVDDHIGEYLLLRQMLVNIIQEMKNEVDMDSRDEMREDEIKSFLIAQYPEVQETIETVYNHLFNQHE